MRRATLYNPAFLQPEDLIRDFVARHDELAVILKVIGENTGPSNQHLLILGGRGLGKSTLVHRVAVEVHRTPALAERILPLIFPEEAYEVANIGEFWLEALSRLADREPSLEPLRARLHADHDVHRVEQMARGAVRAHAERLGRRVLLIVENLDMLLSEIPSVDASALRATLQGDPTFMLLATALRPFNAINDHEQPFYQGFRQIRLHPLTTPEIVSLWASVSGHPPDRRRAEAIRVLSGGNPRMVRLLAELTDGLSLHEVLGDLTHLVDRYTDYFKGRIEALDGQQRRVFLAVATLWRPSTAGEIARESRIEAGATTVSTVLARLERDGRVEVVGKKGKNKLYQVSERLYNIYYLLRRKGGVVDARIQALVDFMLLFYAPDTVGALARRLADEAEVDGADTCVMVVQQLLAAKRDDSEYRAAILGQLPGRFLDRIDPAQIDHARRQPQELLALLTGPEGSRFVGSAEDALMTNVVTDDPRWAALADVETLRTSVSGAIWRMFNTPEAPLEIYDRLPVAKETDRYLAAFVGVLLGLLVDAPLRPWRARVEELKSPHADALLAFLRLDEDPVDAEALRVVLSSPSTRPAPFLRRLVWRVASQKPGPATALLADALQTIPDPAPWELAALAQVQAITGRQEAALATAERLLQTGSQPADAAWLAAVLAVFTDQPKALALARQSNQLSPSRAALRFVAAQSLRNDGPAALDAATTLLTLDADDAVAWAIIAQLDPGRHLAGQPGPGWTIGSVYANDRRVWEAAAKAGLVSTDPAVDVALVQLDGLLGRPDLAAARFTVLATRKDAETAGHPALLDLALTLAASGQGATVRDALAPLAVFRPLLLALDPTTEPTLLAAEERAVVDDLGVRLEERRKRADLWRDGARTPNFPFELPPLDRFAEPAATPEKRPRDPRRKTPRAR